MNTLPVCRKIFKNARSAGELWVLFFALAISITAISTITLFNSRISQSISQNTAERIGAELIISAGKPLPMAITKRAKSLGLAMATKTNFLSMATHNTQFKLTSVMAATENYPLRGQIKIKTDAIAQNTDAAVPDLGNAYIEPRLLTSLNLTLGKTITIGQANFTITGLLVSAPSPSASLINFAPRILINAKDLAKTQVIKPGSRVQYQWFFTGKPAALSAFQQTAATTLDRQYRVITTSTSRQDTDDFLNTATRFMNLSAMVSILFAGIAMIMSTNWFFQRQQPFIALLRTFGTAFKAIRLLYFYLLLSVGVLATLTGLLLGYLIQGVLIDILFSVFNETIAPATLDSLWLSIATGILLLTGFSLPHLLLIKTIQPMSLFQKRQHNINRPLLFATIAAVSVIALLLLYTQDIWLTMISLLFVLGCIALFWFIGLGLNLLLRQIAPHTSGAIKLALLRFTQSKGAIKSQLLAFTLVITFGVFINSMQQDIIKSWQQALPKDTPQAFLVNISPAQKNDFERTLVSLKIPPTVLYPVLRARLIAINDKPLLSVIPAQAKNNNVLFRDLNLSWTNTLPKSNALTAGAWFKKNKSHSKNEVSIDADLAKNLALLLGDALTFSNGATSITATITSFRRIDWNSFSPNFYFLFPQKTLSAFPHTYMTSVYFGQNKPEKLNRLIRAFPNVSIYDISEILNQVNAILSKLNQAILVLLGFIVLAGVAILISANQRAAFETKQQLALLRTFGASKTKLYVSILGQYALLGFISGLVGTVAANIGAIAFGELAFNISYHVNITSIIVIPLISALLVALFSLALNRKILKTPPHTLLSILQ